MRNRALLPLITAILLGGGVCLMMVASFFSLDLLEQFPALCLLPPFLAIGLTYRLRNVYLALLIAIYAGCWLDLRTDPLTAFLRMWDQAIVSELAPADGESSHAKVLLFTLLMGAFVSLTQQIGATRQLVIVFERFCHSRRSGQTGIGVAGLMFFFDDYANCLLLGTSFRNVADRLQISRAKLAFLVDATAAPIAGVAVISTWVGIELSYFSDALTATGYSGPVYSLFLQTIPYRFYPLLMLGMVFLIAQQNRDFGPMRLAELACQHPSPPPQSGESTSVETELPANLHSINPPVTEQAVRPLSTGFALAPFVLLVLLLLGGLAYSGWSQLQIQNASPENYTLTGLLDVCQPNDAMLWASVLTLLCTAILGGLLRRSTAVDMMEAMVRGMQTMFPALLIMVLAWTLSTLCHADHLNIAGFLLSFLGDQLPLVALPTIAFVLCGIISFATGSSWSTMGIMFPILIPLTAQALILENFSLMENSPLLAAVSGSILAGAIWGDHCSPISDTTVLTSAATGCDHVEHVRTQLPYALTVGGVSIFCGTLPVGFGCPVWIVLPAGFFILSCLVYAIGKRNPVI